MTNSKGLVIDLGFSDDIKELTKLNLPDPDLLDYYKRMHKREIFWNMDVDEQLVDFSYKIIEWNKQDKDIPVEQREKIKIFINSDGGCLNSVMNFVNIVKLSKTPIVTICMGKAYSAGFMLLISGHEAYCFSHSDGLLHSGSFGIMNSTEKVMDYIEHTKKVEKLVKDFVINNTKITPKEYDKNYRNEWYMTADDMLKYGVVDKIITDLDEIL